MGNVMRIGLLSLALIALVPLPVETQSLKEITYPSSADNSQQPAMVFVPETKEAVPLVVALHTWSGDYKQTFHKDIAEWCMRHGWAHILRLVEQAAVPPHLQTAISDPSYSQHPPLFRRTSGNVTVTIFQGGHELLPEAATVWFQRLHDEKTGKE
jgi:hypothetical protein